MNGRILATLLIDEMAIRKQRIWNGRNTLGLVDAGLGQSNELATEAYVMMLVSNTENWKVPLGYFFINGLSGDLRANLIRTYLEKCFQVGVNVI